MPLQCRLRSDGQFLLTDLVINKPVFTPDRPRMGYGPAMFQHGWVAIATTHGPTTKQNAARRTEALRSIAV